MSEIDIEYEGSKQKVLEISAKVKEVCNFANLFEPEHYSIHVAAFIFNKPTHYYYCISFKTSQVPYITVMDLMSYFKEIKSKLFIDIDYTKS
jgi:hypothetical protein